MSVFKTFQYHDSSCHGKENNMENLQKNIDDPFFSLSLNYLWGRHKKF